MPSRRSRGREAKLSSPRPAITSALSSAASGPPASPDNAEGPPGEEGGPEVHRTRAGTASSQSGKAGIGSSQGSKAVALFTQHLQVTHSQPCPLLQERARHSLKPETRDFNEWRGNGGTGIQSAVSQRHLELFSPFIRTMPVIYSPCLPALLDQPGAVYSTYKH